MIPWFGWVYLVLLALVGLSGLSLSLRAGESKLRAFMRLGAVGVLALGVVLYFRDAGVPFGFAGFVFVSTWTLVNKSVEDTRKARELGLERSGRIGTAINGLLMLPAVAMSALAIWAGYGA